MSLARSFLRIEISSYCPLECCGLLFPVLKAQLDHFTYVLQRIIERFALRIAALEKGAFDHKKAIFILLYENRELNLFCPCHV